MIWLLSMCYFWTHSANWSFKIIEMAHRQHRGFQQTEANMLINRIDAATHQPQRQHAMNNVLQIQGNVKQSVPYQTVQGGNTVFNPKVGEVNVNLVTIPERRSWPTKFENKRPLVNDVALYDTRNISRGYKDELGGAYMDNLIRDNSRTRIIPHNSSMMVQGSYAPQRFNVSQGSDAVRFSHVSAPMIPGVVPKETFMSTPETSNSLAFGAKPALYSVDMNKATRGAQTLSVQYNPLLPVSATNKPTGMVQAYPDERMNQYTGERQWTYREDREVAAANMAKSQRVREIQERQTEAYNALVGKGGAPRSGFAKNAYIYNASNYSHSLDNRTVDNDIDNRIRQNGFTARPMDITQQKAIMDDVSAQHIPKFNRDREQITNDAIREMHFIDNFSPENAPKTLINSIIDGIKGLFTGTQRVLVYNNSRRDNPGDNEFDDDIDVMRDDEFREFKKETRQSPYVIVRDGTVIDDEFEEHTPEAYNHNHSAPVSILRVRSDDGDQIIRTSASVAGNMIRVLQERQHIDGGDQMNSTQYLSMEIPIDQFEALLRKKLCDRKAIMTNQHDIPIELCYDDYLAINNLVETAPANRVRVSTNPLHEQQRRRESDFNKVITNIQGIGQSSVARKKIESDERYERRNDIDGEIDEDMRQMSAQNREYESRQKMNAPIAKRYNPNNNMSTMFNKYNKPI